MKKKLSKFEIYKKCFNKFLIIIFIFCLLNIPDTYALDMKNNSNQITEELRIKVPEEFKEQWIHAEREIWDPWLKTKDGFLNRQIFWNKDENQGLVIIKWESKEKWKSLSIDEVNDIQNSFEKNVKKSLNLNYNPFELVFEGELYEQF
tara:strand:+ start:2495 stop:2938 length:444 start_codon:yes stop_codon:yes gene_type:complete